MSASKPTIGSKDVLLSSIVDILTKRIGNDANVAAPILFAGTRQSFLKNQVIYRDRGTCEPGPGWNRD
jgi:hypothetical protein